MVLEVCLAEQTDTHLKCMTQRQLEELIPKLVSKATGCATPRFGVPNDKPVWWPKSLEWTSPGDLVDLYQDPCEKLREIVRSCYCYMEQDSLFRPRELSPLSGDLIHIVDDEEMCNADVDSKSSFPGQAEPSSKCSLHVTQDSSQSGAGTLDTADIQSQFIDSRKRHATSGVKSGTNIKQSVLAPTKSNMEMIGVGSVGAKSSESMKAKDTFRPMIVSVKSVRESTSGLAKHINVEDNPYQLNVEEIIDKVAASHPDSEALSHAGEISAEVISQIDLQIAKSLKEAFRFTDNSNLFLPNSDVPKSSSISVFKTKTPNILKRNQVTFPHSKLDTDDTKSFSDSEVLTTEFCKRTENVEKKGRSFVWRTEPGVVEKLLKAGQSPSKVDCKPKESSISKPVSKPHEPSISKPVSKPHELSISKPVSKPCEPNEKKSAATGDCRTVEPGSKATAKEDKLDDEVVWICFICAKSFPDQSELMIHQEACEEETDLNLDAPLPNLTAACSAKGSTSSAEVSNNRPRDSPNLMKQSSSQPVPTLLRKVGSSLKSLPLGLPQKAQLVRRPRRIVDVYVPPMRDVYFECLGLLQTPKLEEINKSPRKGVTEEDCSIIDLTAEDDSDKLAVPTTPRTRSLMSQLSWDGSARKRQLSFSQSVATPPRDKKRKRNDSDDQSSDENDSDDDKQTVRKAPSKSAILGIPLTSPLGQRLKKHWTFDCKVLVVNNPEEYCKTNAFDLHLQEWHEKNYMVEKLRNRPPPTCTFKFTKKYLNKWFHSYKFNKADKREFNKILATGLELLSRLRLKNMTPCKVVLARLTKKEIKFWVNPRIRRSVSENLTKPKPIPRITSVAQLVRYGMNRNLVPMGQSFHPANSVSMFRHQMYPRGMPTPQLLVRSVPMNGQPMRLQVLQLQNSHSPGQFFPLHNIPVPQPVVQTHAQKRKQVFSNVRQDDMVICLSSDEEDGEVATKPEPACVTCTTSRMLCDIHRKRKIGPASYMASCNEQIKASARNIMQSKPLHSAILSAPGIKASDETIVAGAVNLDHLAAQDCTSHDQTVNTTLSAVDNQLKTSESLGMEVTDETDKASKDKISSDEDMDFEVICIDSDEED
ncbi:uncharacterized protein LOC127857591 [Dreissena polymorpha]|uniref:Nuclear respiratory factor 1 NLS/DNA-binding dimerisation domain-containing protein n=1 Tax=Dreissena polymorpha TaxID=45954 RepID=A0A9D4NA10_DREPO|nr:uncharacterized protein LOC127857591 [Dreissena polymorpha]KAH3892503.1 hypothetical protein DPMN_016621 [Dreissena polymorpha]